MLTMDIGNAFLVSIESGRCDEYSQKPQRSIISHEPPESFSEGTDYLRSIVSETTYQI